MINDSNFFCLTIQIYVGLQGGSSELVCMAAYVNSSERNRVWIVWKVAQNPRKCRLHQHCKMFLNKIL